MEEQLVSTNLRKCLGRRPAWPVRRVQSTIQNLSGLSVSGKGPCCLGVFGPSLTPRHFSKDRVPPKCHLPCTDELHLAIAGGAAFGHDGGAGSWGRDSTPRIGHAASYLDRAWDLHSAASTPRGLGREYEALFSSGTICDRLEDAASHSGQCQASVRSHHSLPASSSKVQVSFRPVQDEGTE